MDLESIDIKYNQKSKCTHFCIGFNKMLPLIVEQSAQSCSHASHMAMNGDCMDTVLGGGKEYYWKEEGGAISSQVVECLLCMQCDP